MQSIPISEIFSSMNSRGSQLNFDGDINEVTIDSRKVFTPDSAMFFALNGAIIDGHDYIKDAINKGIKTFVISNEKYIKEVANCNYILVDDGIVALQELALHYRSKFKIKTIAITGSNGKTTIKEWLTHLLVKRYKVAKSPGSYNSQIGVPLSMFQIESQHELGVFEAGISMPEEMQNLEKIIQPSFGIFTNIGEAHSGGFTDENQKIKEKLKLFENVSDLIICADHKSVLDNIQQLKLTCKIHTWGKAISSTLFRVLDIDKRQTTKIKIDCKGSSYTFEVNVTDDGSIENLLLCMASLLVMGYTIDEAIALSKEIFPLPMRLEMSLGLNDCTIINDAYNHDLTSLTNALEFLQKQVGNKKSLVILSDIEQSSMSDSAISSALGDLLKKYNIDTIWWVGHQGEKFSHKTFNNKQEILDHLNTTSIAEACILIKGARKYQLEQLKKAFSSQRHSSTLTIDLGALDHNLQTYNKFLKPGCGIIAVVKAGAYGSGSVEMARLLQYRGVEYLAVAFADEGVALRQAGISIPIMVLNPDVDSFYHLQRYNLEPEIYSPSLLKAFIQFKVQYQATIPIHLKLDTGMNRLGIKIQDLPNCLDLIKEYSLEIGTVFSHMSGSENADEDSYSIKQHNLFEQMSNVVAKSLGYMPKRHFVNTGGIVRFSDFHHDLVRLGLGLYGIDTTLEIERYLEKVHTFTARIIQIKWVNDGEKIGYNQKGIAFGKTKLAIVNVGYADGLPRGSGLGKYSLRVNNEDAPIIGNVCMDLTILDVTKIKSCQEGDQVEIFGPNKPIEELARINDTIPYEILARISSRVKKEWILG